jgi:hypothetical protein
MMKSQDRKIDKIDGIEKQTKHLNIENVSLNRYLKLILPIHTFNMITETINSIYKNSN